MKQKKEREKKKKLDSPISSQNGTLNTAGTAKEKQGATRSLKKGSDALRSSSYLAQCLALDVLLLPPAVCLLTC